MPGWGWFIAGLVTMGLIVFAYMVKIGLDIWHDS